MHMNTESFAALETFSFWQKNSTLKLPYVYVLMSTVHGEGLAQEQRDLIEGKLETSVDRKILIFLEVLLEVKAESEQTGSGGEDDPCGAQN